jgi:hypothetical protein
MLVLSKQQEYFIIKLSVQSMSRMSNIASETITHGTLCVGNISSSANHAVFPPGVGEQHYIVGYKNM